MDLDPTNLTFLEMTDSAVLNAALTASMQHSHDRAMGEQ